jgi:four helix bundle protein
MKTTMCFEDLDAWKRARELVNGVYSLCRESGVAKDFGLRDQIQRAAVSVMSNV